MVQRDIVVIGASAGGVQALQSLVSHLPHDLEAAVFVVLHVAPDHRSHLSEILQRKTSLPVSFGVDQEEVRPGHIYVSSPDRHLLLDDGKVRLTNGPKENRFRPSVDALFRSAARAYGSRVIGVVLSGALDDGSSGLYAIKSRGGLAIVQDPEEAEVSSMPRHAIQTVPVDLILPAAEIGSALSGLTSPVKDMFNDYRASSPDQEPVPTQLDSEVGVSMGDNGRMREIMDLGDFTPYTCPECHGVLVSIQEGKLLRFRCHTGHAYTLNALMSEMTQHTEDAIMSALRAVEETQLLMSHMKRHLEENEQADVAARLVPKIRQAEKRGALIKQAAMENEVISQDTLEDQ